MAKQLNIDLSIKADTGQAKQAMLELQKQLNAVIETRTITVDDTSINNAKQAAIDLKHHIEAATNANTGKLDLSKFSSSLNKAGQSLQGLYNNLSQVGPAGQAAFLALSQSIAKADTSAISLGGKLNSLMVTLKNTAKWQISSSLLHGFMSTISGAYGYAQDLNESLNNIRIITGQNTDQMAKFAAEANNAAKQLSTTTTEYTNASLIYYQQGLSDEDVKARTDATIKLANVSRQSAEEVSSQMTAIWNNFADGNNNLEYYEDVITKLGATTASSSSEIAEGLQKFAAVADTVDLSYEKASAALATVVSETRQSADIVGTAFKTLFARVEGLSLGETLEDGTDLNKYSKALESVGVNIKDQSGELKSMDTILDDIGAKWETLNKDQQVALAQTVAGVRQYTQFVALMDNYDKVQENEATAKSSSGTVNEQAEIYAESWEAARDRVTAAAEEIYSQLLNDDAFISILNGAEQFLGFISNIIEGLGGLKGVLLLIGSILMQQYAKEVPTMMEKMAMNIRILTGEEEKRRQVMLKENAEIINSQMDKSSSSEVDIQIAGMKKVSTMYADLAVKRKTLSQVEIANYENLIKEAEMRTQVAQAIGRQVDEIKRETDALKVELVGQMGYNNRNHAISSTIESDSFQGNKQKVEAGANEGARLLLETEQDKQVVLEQQKQQYEELNQKKENLTKEDQKILNNLKEQYGDINGINKEISKTQINITKIQKGLINGSDLFKAFQIGATEIGKVQTVLNHVTGETKLWTKKMKEATDNPEKMAALRKELTVYAEKMEKAGMNTKQLKEDIENLGDGEIGIEEIINGFKDLGEVEIADAADRLEKMKIALNNLGMDTTKLSELQLKLQKGGQAAEEAKAEIMAMEQQLGQLPNHVLKNSEAFTQMGSMIMQVSMAINALKNIGNIWSDKDLSTGEKILQTMTAFGTVLPIVTSLINKQKISELGGWAAKKLGIEATVMQTTAEGASIPVKIASGEAGWAALGPLLLYVAIAAAVVASIVLIVDALSRLIKTETQEEQAVKKANQELENAKTAAENAKKAYEDLKSKVSDYKSATDALKKYVKGTQEWKDAFQDVLSKVNDLIATFPKLLTYTNLFNSDGTLNIDTLDQALKDYQSRVSQTNITVAQKQANLQTKTQELSQSKLSAKLNDNFSFEKNDNSVKNSIITEVRSSSAVNSIIEDLVSKNINYNNENDIKKSIQESIKNLDKEGLYNFSPEELEDAMTILPEKIYDLKDDFQNLSNETQNAVTSMINAKNLIAQNFFGEEYEEKDSSGKIASTEALQQDFDKTTQDFNKAYIEALNEAKEGILSNPLSYIYGVKIDNQTLEEAGQRYLNETTDAEEAKWKFDEVNYNAREGTVDFIYKDDKGDVHKKTIDDMREFLKTSNAEAHREAIEENSKEIEEKYKSNNTDLALMDYIVAGNFQGTKVKDITNLSSSNAEEQLRKLVQAEPDEDIIKKTQEYLKNSQGKEMNDAQAKEWINKYYQGIKDVQTSLNDIPPQIKDSMEKGLIEELDVETIPKATELYNKALQNYGQNGVNTLNSIVKKAGTQANDVLKALSDGDIDLTSMNTTEINKALSDLGINCKLSAEDIYNLKQSLLDTTSVTAESAKETYKTVSSVLSKIKKAGDIIEEEDYNTLIELNPAMSSFFTTLADGTHMLTGEIKDFKTAMQVATINELQTAIKNKVGAVKAYQDLSEENSSINRATSTELNNQIDQSGGVYYGTSEYSPVKSTGSSLSGDDLYKKYETQTAAYIKILQDTGGESAKVAEALQKQIDAGENLNQVVIDAAKNFEDLNLSEEDLISKSEEASAEINELNEAIKETQYQNEISNAGLEYETTENYANVLMEVYKAEGLSKDTARELSIANQKLDRGLSSLNDNFEDWSKSLKNTNKTSAEYAETIGNLRASFADLLNIADGNELSLEWIEKWANDADKMKLILDGNVDAIQEFRESAFEEMTTNVFDKVKNSLDNLKKSYEEDEEDTPDWLSSLEEKFTEGKFAADELREAIVNIGNSEIGSGAVLSEEYTNALNTMLAQGLLTEQQLNDIFASIGYKPKVRTENVEQTVEVPIYQTVTQRQATVATDEDMRDLTGYNASDFEKKITWTEQIGTKRMVQSVPTIQIVSDKEENGNIEVINAGSTNITPSYSSTTSGSSSNSGSSSSSSSKTTSAASHKHETNRYSNEENAVEGLKKQYEKLNDAKDKAFGASRIQVMEKELQKLKELKNATSNYLSAIVGNKNVDKIVKAIYNGDNVGSMISSGSIGGNIRSDYNALYGGTSASGRGLEYTAKDSDGNQRLVESNFSLADLNSTFGTNIKFNLDSYGNIQNKDAILNHLQELENRENDAYAAVADPTAESTTEHNRRIALLTEMRDRMSDYEKDLTDLNDQLDQYLEYISQIQEKNAEIITAKMENGVELGKKTIQKIDRLTKVLGDDIYKTPEAMSKYFDATFKEGLKGIQQQGDSYMSALNEAEDKYNRWTKGGGEFDTGAINANDAAELFSSIEDGLDSSIDSLLNLINTGRDFYSNTLTYWNNKIKDVTDSIAVNAKSLDHLQNVLNLLGRSTDYEALGTIIQGRREVAEEDYAIKEKLTNESYKGYQKALQEYEKIKKTQGKEAAEEFYNAEVLVAKKDYETKLGEMEASLESLLTIVNEYYENEKNKTFAEFENAMTSDWGSYEALDSAMARQKSVADEYLTKTNQIYNTNKMLRSLSQDIDKTDSKIAKQKLKAFSDEIEALQKKEKLSQSELDIAQAKYDVLKAQIALEEAQNAKSTVRLQRDSEGNYGYVYTADQDKVADAQQTVADKENALYNLGLKTAQDYEEKLILIKKEYDAALQDLYDKKQQNLLSEEEYMKSLENLNKTYAELEYSYAEKAALGRQTLEETSAAGRYGTALAAAQERYGLEQTEADKERELWTNYFDDVIYGQRLFEDTYAAFQGSSYTAREVAQQGHHKVIKDAAGTLKKDVSEILSNLDKDRKYYSDKAKVDNGDLKKTVDNITTSSKNLASEITKKGGLIDALEKNRTSASNLTSKFAAQVTQIKKNIEKYQTAADKANTLYKKVLNLTQSIKDYSKAASNIPTANYKTVYTTTYVTNGSPSGSGNYNNTTPTVSNNNSQQSNTSKNYFEGISYSYDPIEGGYRAYIKYKTANGTHKITKQSVAIVQDRADDAKVKSTYGYKRALQEYSIIGGKTGMYTGSWDGPDTEENGKLAFLHQKELVLNADDTENILEAVKFIREISQGIDLRAMAQSLALSNQIPYLSNQNQTLQQEVTIHAEFPNATNSDEIEQAFNNLINRATQYAYRQ